MCYNHGLCAVILGGGIMQNTCTFGDARGPPALLSYKLQQQK